MKNLKKYLYLFSFLFLFFIPKVHARIIIPALPFDEEETNYVMSYWGSGVNRMYLTYCKSPNQQLWVQQNVGSTIYGVPMAYCYEDGYYQGYAYRRSVYAELTQTQINDYDFEITGEWGSEQYGSSYNTPIGYIPSTNKLTTWKDYGNSIDNITYDTGVVSGNTNVYSSDGQIILLSEDDYAYSDNDDGSFCPYTHEQIGEASNVEYFYFNVRGDTSVGNPLTGDIYLAGTDFVGLGINADTFADITIENASDNQSNDVNSSYSVDWVNDYLPGNVPAFHLHYSVSDDSSLENVYTSVVIQIKLNPSNVLRYFRQNVWIFAYTHCRPDTLSYGYIDYTTNATISSDPVIKNYISNLSLPNLRFFQNMDTLFPPGPVDSILNLPLSILSSLSSTLAGECLPITLTFPFVNRNITLRCVNSFYQDTGFGMFFTGVGTLASTVILINYFIFLYNWIDDTLRLEHKKLKAWGNGEV